jgi:hypothetical protein
MKPFPKSSRNDSRSVVLGEGSFLPAGLPWSPFQGTFLLTSGLSLQSSRGDGNGLQL